MRRTALLGILVAATLLVTPIVAASDDDPNAANIPIPCVEINPDATPPVVIVNDCEDVPPPLRN